MAMPPLVGRELDLAVALEQLKRVERGTPAALLVRGDAGIGKSRLVAELAGRASQLGYSVLSGRADDLDHGIPYAVFRDVLARLDPESHDAGHVAELRATFDGASNAHAGDGVALTFAAAVRWLRGVITRAPALLVLEDLHVADRQSLALTTLLLRLADVGVLTILTLRPQSTSADLEELCMRMAFDGRGAVVELGPLDRHDTQLLIANKLDAAPDDALIDTIYQASGGNPFFAGEMAESLADGGAVAVDGDKARLVPDAPAIGMRPSTALLRSLFVGTSTDIQLAKVMAVFGRFSLRHLPLAERLTGQPSDAVSQSFDRLVNAGLLVGTANGFEFRHSIVRDTLYEDIGPAERRRIHAAVATELATERRAGILMDVLELAIHVAASAEPGDVEAASVMLEAGRAVAASAPLVSAEYHRRAAGLLPAESSLRSDALAFQARALHSGARPREAADVGRSALARLDPGPLRQATTALVVNDLYLGGLVDEALAVVDDELARGGDRCPLLALRTNLLLQAGRYTDAAAVFPDAVAAVQGEPAPPAAALMAHSHLVQYANHVGRVDVAAKLLDMVAALATDQQASSTVALAAHELIAFTDWRPGLVVRIEEHLATARELRPDAVTLSIGGRSESTQIRLLWLTGHWDAALESIRNASFDLEQRGAVITSQLMLCVACEILIDRGDLDEARATAARLVAPIVSNRRHAALVRARIHHALGESSAATALLEAERADAATAEATVWRTAEIMRQLVDLAIEDGRGEEAHGLADELKALAGRTGWVECQLPALRARALADGDAAAAHDYLALATSERWEVEQAHAALVLGELGIEPGRHLADAYRAFDSFGAAPWRRRAAASLRARGLSVPRRAVSAASPLTETELQLARLVREGLSNRQIATAMHYSRKTIEVYLSRLYTKTGCGSRLALIRAIDTGAIDVESGGVGTAEADETLDGPAQARIEA